MRSRRRLHPAAWAVHALGALREALLPLVLAVVIGGRSVSALMAIGLLAVAASATLGWLRWSRTWFWLDGEALHFVSGILSPDHTSVPIARIAAVDEVQGPVQRLFGVVAVHVQTAGGAAEGEIVLHAVTAPEARELRAALGEAGEEDQSIPALASWRLSTRELLVAAVTGPQIGVVLPVLAGLAGLVSQTVPDDEADDLLTGLPDAVGGWEVLAALVVGAVVVLSLAGAVVAFGGFTVQREPERLRLRRGVLERRAASVGVQRVQAIRIVEGLVRRPLGLCSVRLEVAGYAKEASAAQTLIPLCRRAEVRDLLAGLLPELPVPAGSPQRPPRRALRRYVLPPLIGYAAIAGLAGLAVTADAAPAAWWTAAGALAGVLLGVVRARAAGWWLDGGVVAARRHGLVARTTTVATAERLQFTAMSTSLPQRRARLATVRFAVASGHATGVDHLEATIAAGLLGGLRAARYAAAPAAAGAA